MDQQVLETIIHRLERIETLIDSRTSQTHDRYTEIKEELGIIKADVKEIKVEHVNVVKRVEKIENTITWIIRTIGGAIISVIMGFFLIG